MARQQLLAVWALARIPPHPLIRGGHGLVQFQVTAQLSIGLF
jgi:hypothetical protein